MEPFVAVDVAWNCTWLCDCVALTMLHFLWQGALVAAIVMMAEVTFLRQSASGRHAANLTGLVAMSLCVPTTFAAVVWQQPDSANQRHSAAHVSVLPAISERNDSEFSGTESNAAHDLGSRSGTSRLMFANASEQASGAFPVKDVSESPGRAGTSSIPSWSICIVCVWFVGATVMLLRLWPGIRRGQRLRSTSQAIAEAWLMDIVASQADRLRLGVVPVIRYSRRIAVPMVIGVLKPVVLLPASLITHLDSDQLHAVISHELAHIRRMDPLVNLFQHIVESMLFFHPAVWWISHRVSIEREVCVDDVVVGAGCARIQYAGALIRAAEVCCAVRRQSVLGQVMALRASGVNQSHFNHRVRRLLGEPKSASPASARAFVVASAAVLLTIVSLAVMTKPNNAGAAAIETQPAAMLIAPQQQETKQPTSDESGNDQKTPAPSKASEKPDNLTDVPEEIQQALMGAQDKDAQKHIEFPRSLYVAELSPVVQGYASARRAFRDDPENNRNPDETYVKAMFALESKFRATQYGFNALWILLSGIEGDREYSDPFAVRLHHRRKAVKLIREHYLHRPEVYTCFADLIHNCPFDESEQLLEEARVHSEYDYVKAAAWFHTAEWLQWKATIPVIQQQWHQRLPQATGDQKEWIDDYLKALSEFGDIDPQRVTQSAITVANRVATGDIGKVTMPRSVPDIDVKTGTGMIFHSGMGDYRRKHRFPTYAERAESLLFDQQDLAIGRPAPDITGKDVDDNTMRLSEFRGRVTLLVFSAGWDGSFRGLNKAARELTEKYQQCAFAIASVRNDKRRSDIVKAIANGKVTWPCWYDHFDGPISRKWNIRHWPTTYLLDHRGAIRHRNLPFDQLDAAVAVLLRERDTDPTATPVVDLPVLPTVPKE